MNEIKNKNITTPITASRWQRLVRLTIALLCLLLLTWVAFNSSFQGHQLLYKQSDDNAHSLAEQLALTASSPISKMDKPRLVELVNNISTDRYVQSASVYNQHGVLLAASDDFHAFQRENGLTPSTAGISKLKQPVVIPVLNANHKPIGFVRVNYLPQSAIATSHSYFHEVSRQVLLMLLIVCVVTWQIGRSLKRWQINRYIRKVSTEDE